MSGNLGVSFVSEVVTSCKVILSFNSDSWRIFWIARAAESSLCNSSCWFKCSSSFSWSFSLSYRLSFSWHLFSMSNFTLSFAVSTAACFKVEVEEEWLDDWKYDTDFLDCTDLCESSSALSISWSFILTLTSAKQGCILQLDVFFTYLLFNFRQY